ncbi:hypothetical protein AB0G15_05415 [Streptosporangium sp. NPDC023825]|uniref:hypothetical protein n=1 Tax=Streptosporangium sp. NPDC023825 TaxID=3154909 RepID=UPI003444E601
MTASYPNAYRQWTTKRNYLDIVWAEHMNSVQDETSAIQQTLGIVPQIATANPGMVNPNHGTVAARIQHVARGEQIPIFRGSTRDATVTPGVWVRPTLRADDDPFSMSTGTGIKINESGLWQITLKCDWKSVPATVQHQAARLLRLEINGDDVGVRNVIEEIPQNRAALHNHLTWTENLAKNTTISMGVRTNTGGSPGELIYNAYMRVHMVRCHPPGEGGPIPFEDIPDVEPPPQVVVTPSTKQYTIIATLYPVGGTLDHDYSTGWTAGSPPGVGANIEVVDSTHPAFASSPYPKFNSLAEAQAYANEKRQNYFGAYAPRNTYTYSGAKYSY